MPMLTSCLPELFLALKAACKKVHVCKTTSRAEFLQINNTIGYSTSLHDEPMVVAQW